MAAMVYNGVIIMAMVYNGIVNCGVNTMAMVYNQYGYNGKWLEFVLIGSFMMVDNNGSWTCRVITMKK